MATQGTQQRPGGNADGSARSKRWTASEIAADVRDGRRTAVSAVEEALARIERDDEIIGAFQLVRAEKALAEAAAIDADPGRQALPLAGVPVAIKDNISVAGEPTRSGSLATPEGVTAADHEVVTLLRQAGAIVVGKTRLPELGLWATTDSAFGVTRNPWNLSLTAGGSSGGAAAAVASGMLPFAHGNDGLGSIRGPAAATGLVGLKPGRGRVPAHVGPTDWYGMTENGMLTTNVADGALGLSVLTGEPELATVHEPRNMMVAISYRSPVAGVFADAAFKSAARTVGTLLARAGHEVEENELTYPPLMAIHGFARWFVPAADDADLLDPEKLQSRTKMHAALGRLVRPYHLHDERYAESFRNYALEMLTTYDVIVTPGLAHPPIAADTWSERSWLANITACARYAPYQAPWNIVGFPAVTVPVGLHSKSGTPVSAQIIARPGREDLLLGVAATIERLRPWQRIAPGF
jgi:amidase